MIHIEHVDLDLYGVKFPTDQLGLVLAQPFLELSNHEPFQCSPGSKPGQLKVLRDALEVALAKSHGADKTHFTVLPEYSIPGIEGVRLIDELLAAETWPTGTIVMGGTDGLSRGDYVKLATEANSHVNSTANDCNRISDNQWVNCGIVWVKANDGVVHKWLQPKMFPALEEQDAPYQDMFCGKSIFSFHGLFSNGTAYRFSLLICFDWVASFDGKRAWQWLLEDLDRAAQTAAGELPLSWLFIVQHNPRPSHHTFLSAVGDFFNQINQPRVSREKSCLVFANTAGKATPGRVGHHGNTSLVQTRQTLFCDPSQAATFANGGYRQRLSTLLQPYRDILFREGGACIHSFALINPRALAVGPAGRQFAIKHASVFPIHGTNDPRVPSSGVAASIKWINDELDELLSLASRYPAAVLSNAASGSHSQATNDLRVMSASHATACITKATCKSGENHPDKWDGLHSEALAHLVHTLTIIGIAYPISVKDSHPSHATFTRGSTAIDLMAITGHSHEDCLEHLNKDLNSRRRQTILISRDDDNTKWNPRFGRFLDTSKKSVTAERKITEPFGGVLQVSYSEILEDFLASPDTAEMTRATDVRFTS